MSEMETESGIDAGLEEAVRLAEIGEYLYAHAHSYGDGYTEPREFFIGWEWQQSKPEEYGQGVLLAEAVRWHEEMAEDGIQTEATKLRGAATRIADLERKLKVAEEALYAVADMKGWHERAPISATGRQVMNTLREIQS